MDESMLATMHRPSALVRWCPGAGRPPVLFVLLVFALLLAAVLAGPASGATVSGYREEIRVARDGSAAVTLAIGVSGAPGEVVRLPFGHAKADLATLRLSGAVGARVATLPGDLPVLEVTLPAEPAPLDLRFSVPGFVPAGKPKAFGNRLLAHELVNATSLSCGRYEGTFLVPEGYGLNTVVETEPAESETSATHPYEVVRVDGRDGLRLVRPSLGPAERVVAKVRYKPTGRSPVLLAALLAAGVFYLVAFRDLAGGAR